jgi:hypothetical protein
MTPFFKLLILSTLMSMQVTELPVSAKQVPVTRPTYPVPTTAIFIFDSIKLGCKIALKKVGLQPSDKFYW